MFRILGLALLTLCLLGTTGCYSTGGPNWLHPGDTEYQQQQAVVHDPYPDNDQGPEVVGVRPRDYDKPLAEPVRNQMWSNWGG